MPIHHGAFHQKKPPTVDRFFDEHAPRLLAAREALCRSFKTTLAFTIGGASGGSWTLDFTKPRVERGVAPDARAHLELSADDFVRLLEGKLDVTRAMAEGAMRFSGEVAALRALVTVFSVADGDAA